MTEMFQVSALILQLNLHEEQLLCGTREEVCNYAAKNHQSS